MVDENRLTETQCNDSTLKWPVPQVSSESNQRYALQVIKDLP